MGNPSAIADIIKVIATISSGGGVSIQAFSDPAFVSTFASSGSFPGRVKRYTGTVSAMLDELVADGFAKTSAAYRQVTAAGIQTPNPVSTIFIGRADAGDADWATSLAAIWAEANASDYSLYFLCVDERDPAQMEAIADWVHINTFALYVGATASATLLNNQPGNVALNLITKGYDTTAIIYHDPAVASNYAPPVLSSLRGPFVLPALSGDFKIRIDAGAEQTFTLIANPATVTGSNTGPFVIANGAQFSTTVDNGTIQTITASVLPAVVSSVLETYNIIPGTSLQASFNGAAAVASTFTGTAGSVTIDDEPYAFNLADSVTFAIDGGGNQIVTFLVGDTTRVLVAARLTAGLTGVTVIDTGTGVSVTSNTTGSDSDVEIVAIDANTAIETGLAVGPNAGAGFAGNFAIATAAELKIKLDADFAAATVTNAAGVVTITTTAVGKAAAVRVVSGLANDAIGFPTDEFRGSGDFNDGSAVTTAEVVTWMGVKLYALSVSNTADAVTLTTRSRGSQSTIDIPVSALGTVFGFAVTTTPSVGSNVGNAAEANASEISSVILATIASGTSAAASARFTISSLVSGPVSTVELTGGTYADSLFGDVGTATGTGTDEDYIDCAYVGRQATLQLDSPVAGGGGQGTWDNVPLTGIFPDSISDSQRKTLHETLKINTYEKRLGVTEMHFGTVVYGQTAGLFRYIDERVTTDWGKARSVETFKATLNVLAAKKVKAPNTDEGIALLANDWKRMLQSGEANGHWIFDDTTIQSATDTGITIPTRAQQSAEDVLIRRVSGFAARFELQGAIHRVSAVLDLTIV